MAPEQPEQAMHVVIVGGGIAALETLMALRDHAEERVRITLVAPDDAFVLKPLRTAEAFGVEKARGHGLREIADHFRAELVHDQARRIDGRFRSVVCASGATIGYDAVVLAPGARARPAYASALTSGAERDPRPVTALLADIERHNARSVAFIVPAGVTWPLPLYEVALMTARLTRAGGAGATQLTLITPEPGPLALFGAEASAAVRSLLEQAGVGFWPNSTADVGANGRITVTPGAEHLHADRVVSLPVLEGPGLDGVTADAAGFIPVDEHGRVEGMHDVYAAGDATSFPVKQGGVACQQADAVAEHLAARAGAAVEPRPFRPVLRGKLLTGAGAQFLRHDLAADAADGDTSDYQLWFPPAKVAGYYLSRWLAWEEARDAPRSHDEVRVEVALPPGLRTGDAAIPAGPPA